MNSLENLNWLLTAFTRDVPDVAHAAVVSAGGLPLACSHDLSAEQVDVLAAVTSGLTSLVQGAARAFSGGPVAQTVVVMQEGTLIMKLISDASVLAVLTSAECDLGLVTYEMALLSDRASGYLAPGAGRPLIRRAVGRDRGRPG